MKSKLDCYDLGLEKNRTYHFQGASVTIEDPVKLYCREEGHAHRVLDAHGKVFILPSIGIHGCYITYEPRDLTDPVQF